MSENLNISNFALTSESSNQNAVRQSRAISGALLGVLLVAGACTPQKSEPSAPSPGMSVVDGQNGNVGLADPSLIGMSSLDLERRFSLIDLAGADTVRTDLSWRTAQPNEKGGYNWSKFDPIADAAGRHQKSLDAILDYAPPWAAQPGCDAARFRCAPRDINEFGNFAVEAAKRYGSKVRTYELWNEPNIRERWDPQPDVAQYAKLVREVCPRIKQADPQARVILGGLALGNHSGDVPMLDFVRQLYDNNPGNCFDALSVHFYSSDTPTWDLISAIHGVMVDHNDSRPIWGTEAGIPTSGPCGDPNNSSEKNQAQALEKAITVWRGYPWAGKLLWFTVKDLNRADNHFGLICENGTDKPAFAVFRRLNGAS